MEQSNPNIQRKAVTDVPNVATPWKNIRKLGKIQQEQETFRLSDGSSSTGMNALYLTELRDHNATISGNMY
ncbi:hypothetical protein KSU07_00255 [Fusobacterium animalis]